MRNKVFMFQTKFLVLFAVFGLLLSVSVQAAENTPVTNANYKLAERFAPNKMNQMVFSTSVSPHWMKQSERFWYIYETSQGKTFYIVDPAKKTKRPIFDNDKMAALLTTMTKDPYDAQHLPIDTIRFIRDEKFIYFKVNKNEVVLEAEKRREQWKKEEEEKEKKEGQEETEVKKKKEKSEIEKAKEESQKYHHFEFELATGKLTMLENYVEEPSRPSWANISPDGETVLFGRHYNIFAMSRTDYKKWLNNPDDETIEEVQLTTDGQDNFSYHSGGRGETNVSKEKEKDDRKPVRVYWSHDSKKFAMTRSDQRKVKDLWVINSVAEPRPTLETYKYQMPGEEEAPQIEIFVFDLGTKEKIQIKAERYQDQTVSIFSYSYPVNTRDDRYRPTMWISKSVDKLYFSRQSRDQKRIDTCVADTSTGEVKILIEESLNTYVEDRRIGFVNDGKELIQWSERDGWAHFYLYDGEGNLKNRLTSGPYHCEDLVGIDEKNRVVYFEANGREEGEDPYYLHLYRVGFDGTGLKLLNRDNFNHSVSMNDSNTFVIDNYSRVDTAPTSVLRDSLGNKILDLETADLSLLMAAGFQFPETFKVKAGDGVTDLFGVMYKPFDFDASKLYPIIAYVYPGPQTESVAKSFSSRGDTTWRLAQFGFIVITVGNRGGHPSRSKWYHNFGYGNLRDYGLADKKTTIEQLADRYGYIDIEKVGIFGHSGGGFMSTAAMLVYPDFFKVAVSSSGNHENNIYNRWWSEQHHGVTEVEQKDGSVKFEYDIEKNSEIAGNLKGRLLICTGDIDNNVHPGNTIRLANALIKANKRFDFFLFPGQRHGYGSMNEYFFWLRADYFCKHLIGDYSQTVDIDEINRDIEKSGTNRR